MLTSTPGGRRPDATVAEDKTTERAGSTSSGGLNGLLARARDGDSEARETLLQRYTPFALKVASRVTGGYVELGRDDEASVALLAFNEAIDSYDPGRGASFLGFLGAVIRRRLIDEYRRRRSERREVLAGSLADMSGTSEEAAVRFADGSQRTVTLGAVQVVAAESAHRDWETRVERREEVGRYRDLLALYGISLADLVRISPRHADARQRAIEVARSLAARPDLVEHLRRRGELPLRSLDRLAGVSRKTLERQRKYIIAVTLILTEDLPHLKEYLR